MTEPEGHYEVGVSRHAVYVRVIGLASMYNAACVRDLIEQMLDEGHQEVVFDLEECIAMDSTFLGVLAGAATHCGADGMPKVTVLNASAANLRLLEGVGLTELIGVCSAHVDPPDVRLEALHERTQEAERLELVRAAHERLIQIDERNEEGFGSFLSTLNEEMAGQKRPEN